MAQRTKNDKWIAGNNLISKADPAGNVHIHPSSCNIIIINPSRRTRGKVEFLLLLTIHPAYSVLPFIIIRFIYIVTIHTDPMSIEIHNTSCPSANRPSSRSVCVIAHCTTHHPVCLILIRRHKKRYRSVPGAQCPEIGIYEYISCHADPLHGLHDGRHCQSDGGQGKNGHCR